jgi:prophage DNA circulation protein
VIGPDYWPARDALRAALAKPGPGELIHPYLGKKQVMATGATMSESFDEGGMARFSLEFTETSEPLYPSASQNGFTAIAGKSYALQAVSEQSFIAKVGGWIKTASNYAQKASSLISGGLVRGVLDVARQYFPVGATLGAISSLSRAGVGIVSLVRNPKSFASGFGLLTGNFQSIAAGLVGQGGTANRKTAQAAYRAAGGVALPTVIGKPTTLNAPMLSPSRAAQVVRANVAAGTAFRIPAADLYVTAGGTLTQQQALVVAIAAEIAALGRRLMLAAEAQTTALMTWDSYQEAMADRASLSERLAAEAEIAPDDVAQALLDLRAAVVADITARAADLRRLDSVTPPQTVPACVLAYRLYGDATQADDLTTRNRVIHPGFVAGGSLLEVLSA